MTNTSLNTEFVRGILNDLFGVGEFEESLYTPIEFYESMNEVAGGAFDAGNLESKFLPLLTLADTVTNSANLILSLLKEFNSHEGAAGRELFYSGAIFALLVNIAKEIGNSAQLPSFQEYGSAWGDHSAAVAGQIQVVADEFMQGVLS